MSLQPNQPIQYEKPPVQILSPVTLSQCTGNAVSLFKSGGQSHYMVHLDDSLVESELSKRNILSKINRAIQAENNKRQFVIEHDRLNWRTLSELISKWNLIELLRDHFIEVFHIIFENRWRLHQLLVHQNRAQAVRKPIKSVLNTNAKQFAYDNVGIYMNDAALNNDKFRKHIKIKKYGACMQYFFQFQFDKFTMIDEKKQNVDIFLKPRKYAFTETYVMLFATWIEKLIALPRFDILPGNNVFEKMDNFSQAEWTDELLAHAFSEIRISGADTFLPNHIVVNSKLLNKILDRKKLDDIGPKTGRSRKAEELEEQFLDMNQKMEHATQQLQTKEREYDELKQQYDSVKAELTISKHQAEQKYETLKKKAIQHINHLKKLLKDNEQQREHKQNHEYQYETKYIDMKNTLKEYKIYKMNEIGALEKIISEKSNTIHELLKQTNRLKKQNETYKME
eukprot:517461_1